MQPGPNVQSTFKAGWIVHSVLDYWTKRGEKNSSLWLVILWVSPGVRGMSPWSVWQKWVETLWDFCNWDRGTWKSGVDFDVLQRLQRLSAVSLCTASYKKLFRFTIHIPGTSWRCPVCFMCSALVVLVCTLGVVIIHFYQNYTVSAVITAKVLLCWVPLASITPQGHLLTSCCSILYEIPGSYFFFLAPVTFECVQVMRCEILCFVAEGIPPGLPLSLIHFILHRMALDIGGNIVIC